MESRTLYVETLFWRNCDPFLSVAGFDHKTVKARASELAKDELDEAVDQELVNADDDTNEADVRDNLETELCSSGVNQFTYPTDAESLGLDSEHLQELEQDGITVY